MECEEEKLLFDFPLKGMSQHKRGWVVCNYHGRKLYSFGNPDILKWVKDHPSTMYSIIGLETYTVFNRMEIEDFYSLSEELEAWFLLRWA